MLLSRIRSRPVAYSSAFVLIFASSLSACSPGDEIGDPDPSSSGGAGDISGSGGDGTGSTMGTGGTSAAGGTTATGGDGQGSGSTSSSGGSADRGGGDTSAGGELGSGGTQDASGGSAAGGGASSGGGGDDTIRPARLEGFGKDTTGGLGGSVVTAATGTAIHKAICDRADDDTPLIIMVNGTITPGNTLKQSGSCNTADGVIELKEVGNISLIGVGKNGVLDQIGIHIRRSSNIIIQNLTIKNVRKSNTSTPSNGGDAIGMESDVSKVWIDHNEIYGSTTEGEEHDGLIDFKARVVDVTVSFNHLHDSGRGGLIGSNDDGDDGSTRITFHHNWYHHINSRTHLVREAHGHWYNNYFSEILSTGINVRNGARLLIEGNYFTEARNPLGTFYYLDNPGQWQVKDNYFDSSVVWQAANDEVIAGPNVQSTGSVTVPYDYTLDPSGDVPQVVVANVGVGKI